MGDFGSWEVYAHRATLISIGVSLIFAKITLSVLIPTLRTVTLLAGVLHYGAQKDAAVRQNPFPS